MAFLFQLGEYTRRMRCALVLACALGGVQCVLAQGAAQSASVPKTPMTAAETPKIADEPMPVVPGTELDRVVAVVNGDLVLDSDVDEERRMEAFEPYRDPGSSFSRDRTIERLINRDLILQQAKVQTGDQVTDAQVKEQVDGLRKAIPACKSYHCETQGGWEHFLADNGFTEATFDRRWKQRMEVLDFIEERFRMGITITPADIQGYYVKTMLPAYRRQKATPPKLDAVSPRIQEVLLQQRVSSLLSDWLKSLRAQGGVVVLHPGEEVP